MHLIASTTGEMAVSDVPLAPWVDMRALTKGDSDKLEIVAEVPAGKSRRDWRYTAVSLRKIAMPSTSTACPATWAAKVPTRLTGASRRLRCVGLGRSLTPPACCCA